MPLQADQVADRRRLKRRLALWQVAAVVAGAVAVLALLAPAADGLDTGGPHVARLEIAGIIVDDRERDETLAEIAGDDDAKALLVRIDSPGGTVVGGESLYHSLRAVAEKKPVVAVMGEVATSAAYMAAVATDHVVARAGTVTGSIGVILQTADLTSLLDTLGIKPETVKSSPLKAQPNPLEPFSDEAREVHREVVRDLYDMFVGLVAERRALAAEAVKPLADGRIFTGRQALENGLIDAIGGETEARAWLEEKHGISADLDAHDVEIEREKALWRRVLDEGMGKGLLSERLTLDGLISLWHPVAW